MKNPTIEKCNRCKTQKKCHKTDDEALMCSQLNLKYKQRAIAKSGRFNGTGIFGIAKRTPAYDLRFE